MDARRLLRPNAFGGMLTFGVKGDAQIGSEVVDKLKLASNLANVGGSFSVVWGGRTLISEGGLFAPSTRRRREDTCHSPRYDDPSATKRGGTARVGRDSRLDSSALCGALGFYVFALMFCCVLL